MLGKSVKIKMEKLVSMNLPPFAILQDKELTGRCVLLHIRSASVIEILKKVNLYYLENQVLSMDFTLCDTKYMAMLHYCATLDKELDAALIKEHVLNPAINYFIENI